MQFWEYWRLAKTGCGVYHQYHQERAIGTTPNAKQRVIDHETKASIHNTVWENYRWRELPSESREIHGATSFEASARWNQATTPAVEDEMGVANVRPLVPWSSSSKEPSSVASMLRSWKRFIKGASFFFFFVVVLGWRYFGGISSAAAHSSLSHSILDPLYVLQRVRTWS